MNTDKDPESNTSYNTIGSDQENPKIDLADQKNTSTTNMEQNKDQKPLSDKITSMAGSVKTFFKKAISNENKAETPKSNESEELDCRKKALVYMQEKVEVETSYKTFVLIISIGSALFCLSLFFLPMIVISPRKFVSFFSLGSLLILTSFIFVYGTKTYFEKLCSKERFAFTSLFFVSIVLGIFCAIINSFFFLSLICAAVQLVSLIVFILSFIPGGKHGISAIGSMISSPVVGLWTKIRGGS